jgi:RNA polymerase sigma-70 factor (ECF subfamily)
MPDVESRPDFRSVYDQFADDLRRYVTSKIGAVEEAEDMLQEIFLAAWKSRGSLPEIRAYKSWLFSIAHNKVVDYYRHNEVQRKILGHRSARSPDIASDEPNIDQADLSAPDLTEARAGLSGDDRKLFDLIYWFNLSYREAAQLIGVPVGTLKSRMHDLRNRIRANAGRYTPRVITGAQKRKLSVPKGGDWKDPDMDRVKKATVQYVMPGMDDVKVVSIPYSGDLAMDVYYPSDFRFDELLPVVVMVMGYSNEQFTRLAGIKLKDLTAYPSWGQLIAASGMVGVAYETDDPDDDIHVLLDFITRTGNHLGIDSTRICIWACSANVIAALQPLTETHRPYASNVKCGVLLYPGFTHFRSAVDGLPAVFERNLRNDTPLFIVEIGKEALQYKPAIVAFVKKVRSTGMPLEHVYYEEGVHGFDLFMNGEKPRAIINQCLAYMRKHLFS